MKDPEVSSTGKASQTLAIKQGMEGDVAKIIVAAAKSTKLKIQAQIQGSDVRVTGKNRDDLQEVMAALRAQADTFPVSIGFKNFRD